MHGIRSAYSGDALVSPSSWPRSSATLWPARRPRRTQGQIDSQLLTLIGEGLSNAEIGEELHLATSTVQDLREPPPDAARSTQ